MPVTAAQMKEIERNADAAGLSYYQMMENAGTGAYRIICGRYPKAERYIIFIGKGNNGGDGCVVARLAAQDGKRVLLITVEGNPVTTDAAVNFGLLKSLPVEIKTVEEAFGDVPAAAGGTVVIDAVYGTGFHGALRSTGERACRLINGMDAPVVALDVPSGINCDTGEAAENAVEADLTVSFHAFKPVHEIEEAKKYCGESIISSIGI